MSMLIHKAPVMLGNFILKHNNRILTDSIPAWDTRINVSFTDSCTLDKASLSNTINAYLAAAIGSSASLRHIYRIRSFFDWIRVHYHVCLNSSSQRMTRFWRWDGRVEDSQEYSFFRCDTGCQGIYNQAYGTMGGAGVGFFGTLGFDYDSTGGTYTNPEDIVALPDSVFGTHSQSVSWSFYVPEIASYIYNAADALSAFVNDFTLTPYKICRSTLEISFTYSRSYNGNSYISYTSILLNPNTMQPSNQIIGEEFPVSVPVSVSAVSSSRSIYSSGNFVDYVQ